MNLEDIISSWNGCVCSGGGGGGGSKFSTAQVTFVNSYNGYFPEIIEDEGGSAVMFINATHSGTITVPLYDGNLYVDARYSALSSAIYSGNAELIADNTMLHIFGDCTITT